MYKFTIVYTINHAVPVGAGLISRSATVYGETVDEAIEKVKKLDKDYLCVDTITATEVLNADKEN